MSAIYSIGQIAHFMCSATNHRPALITSMWPHRPVSGSLANLTIFLDDERDEQDMQRLQEALGGESSLLTATQLAPLIWHVTGAAEDKSSHQVGTWHWPETP